MKFEVEDNLTEKESKHGYEVVTKTGETLHVPVCAYVKGVMVPPSKAKEYSNLVIEGRPLVDIIADTIKSLYNAVLDYDDNPEFLSIGYRVEGNIIYMTSFAN